MIIGTVVEDGATRSDLVDTQSIIIIYVYESAFSCSKKF